MPHFSIPIGPNGPLLDAYVSVSQARWEALQKAKQLIPPNQKIRALLDTGASGSCLDPSVVTALDIPPHSTCLMNTPTTGATPQTANLYDIGIGNEIFWGKIALQYWNQFIEMKFDIAGLLNCYVVASISYNLNL